MRFFRAVEGHKVNRFGTSSRTSGNEPFGYKVDGAGAITWDTEAVLVISDAEADRFRREYDKLVKHGALVELQEADWNAWRAARKERAKKLAAEIGAVPAEDAAARSAPAGEG